MFGIPARRVANSQPGSRRAVACPACIQARGSHIDAGAPRSGWIVRRAEKGAYGRRTRKTQLADPGYHCDPKQPLPLAGLASQKNHMSIHLMCVYGDADHEAWFRQAWAESGKKLDMGKSCVRFKKLDDVPLKVIGAVIKRVPAKKFIAHYEAAIGRVKTAAAQKSTRKRAKKTARKVAAKCKT